MKKALLIAALTLASLAAKGQSIVYYSADGFPLYGKVTESTSERYTRLPAFLQDSIRKELWDLGMDSAGLRVRFRTNSTNIKVKWTSIHGTAMNHMCATGIRGLDLYILDNGVWRFVKSAIPSTRKESEKTVAYGLEPYYREYMLHLPLYDGIRDFEIGIDSAAVITAPLVNSPRREKPVVIYGTSIMQGGCVTRPGMASSNILARKLDRDVINLGFSGNARLDLEIADLMAAVPDPGVYVMDNLPNCTAKMVAERTEEFVRRLRDAHPDTPIIFVENPYYTHAHYIKSDYDNMTAANDSLKVIYKRYEKAGMKNIYYVDGSCLSGADQEGTVDGSHFTDLGMTRYVDILLPVIRKALKGIK